MATIVDVAKEADVSLATVSRVLNKSFMVSDEKRLRVEAAIQKLGYQHSQNPQGARKAGAKLVFVITSIHQADLFDGMIETAGELGYELIISYISDREDGWKTSARIMKTMKREWIAGVITNNAAAKNNELRQILRPYPLVQVGEPLDMQGFGENYLVSVDNVQAAYDLTSHLIETGRRRIAFMCIDNYLMQGDNNFILQREKGYLQALQEHGIDPDPALKLHSDVSAEDSASVTEELLRMKNPPDAIFCINDMMASGCLKALREAGVRVPEDIAVCGFDNMEFSDFLYPSLTTIDQSFEEMGTSAIRMLHQVITGEIGTGRKLFINHKLLVRQSTMTESEKKQKKT